MIVGLLSFFMLGFLIGNLAGLSAEGIVRDLLPLLFAFGGGSAVGLMNKLDQRDKRTAYKAIFALSLSCLLGTYTGILVSEYQILTPESRREERHEMSIVQLKYLRSHLMSEADTIDQLYSRGVLTQDKAYEALYDLIKEQEDSK